MNIQQYWKDTLAQNAAAMRAYFHPTAYVNWHNTNEHFTVEEFIRANCEYSGDWDGEVERMETVGDVVITVTRVWCQTKPLSFHVTSFIRLQDARIVSIDEYWGDDGKAPDWRLDKHIGTTIV